MIKASWIAHSHRAHEYNVGWYAGLFLFGAILIAWALYSNNIITTILFALMVLVIYISSHQNPEKIMVEISDKGVNLNGVFYPYQNLKHFWIIRDEDHSELTLETTSILNKHLPVQLDDEDPELIRTILG